MPHADEDRTILEALLAAQGGFVSGSVLAETLGLSRVSVRTRIQALEADGFVLEAVRNKGYRLVSEPKRLHHALLEAYLLRQNCHNTVHTFEVLDSTNSEAERLLTQGADTPFVVSASRQEAGRGRMGRAWASTSSQNVYLSFAFRPQLPPARMTLFTLWMGVSICHWLDTRWGAPVQVKWPNDLLCGGRKLAGMLTEARIDADYTRDLIFGLGLNINADADEFPEAVRDMATSLKQVCGGKALPLNELSAGLIACVSQAYESFEQGAFESTFKKHWIDYDCLNGKRVSVKGRAGELEGTVAGLNEDGSLAIIRDDGSRIAVRAGDVSLGTQSMIQPKP